MVDEISFEDFVFYQGGVPWPEVCVDGENRVLISDHNGRIAHVDLVNKTTLAEAFSSEMRRMVCHEFQSLSFDPQHRLAAVAAQGYTFIWAVGTREVMKLRPHQYGCVDCVAFSLDGQFLALGIGYYPLSEKPVQARLELWSCQDWSFVGHLVMPGVCVDRICWTNDNRIVCAVGMRSQQEGQLAIIEPRGLKVIAFQSAPFVFVRNLFLTDLYHHEDLIVVVHHYGISAFTISDDYIDYGSEWEFPRKDEHDLVESAALDEERYQVVLSSGAILRAADGVQVGQLPALPDCSCVAVSDSRGYIGVSSKGVLRVWTLTANREAFARP